MPRPRRPPVAARRAGLLLQPAGLRGPIQPCATTSRHRAMQIEPNDDEEASSRAEALHKNLITRLPVQISGEGVVPEALLVPITYCCISAKTMCAAGPKPIVGVAAGVVATAAIGTKQRALVDLA
uniref:Uncharacterized protein n=1 Tax=Oryza sativa subsp. japonica TaxID=39947 RepID=Q69NC7_ORYSJ|nr:hypothetical protein [Oryza sativa Japonica Group]